MIIPKWVGEEHSIERKTADFDFASVVLPAESFGDCRRSYRCGNVGVALGNGLCMQCWDKGLEKSYTKQEAVEQSRLSRGAK